MANCKFCGEEITWMKEGSKNVPIESDGSLHRCQEMKDSVKSLKKMDRNSLSEEEIKQYEQSINKPKKKKFKTF